MGEDVYVPMYARTYTHHLTNMYIGMYVRTNKLRTNMFKHLSPRDGIYGPEMAIHIRTYVHVQEGSNQALQTQPAPEEKHKHGNAVILAVVACVFVRWYW